MRTILVPTDFSAHSTQAAHFAIALGNILSAQVHLLHIGRMPVIPVSVPTYGITSPFLALEPAMKEMRQEANVCMKDLTKELEGAARQFGYHGPIYQTIVEGEPVEEITRWIEEHEPMCMVMGVTNHSSIYRMLIGSVAGRLLKETDIPIFAIPSGAVYGGMYKVVFASDFDPNDAKLLHRMNEMLQGHVNEWHVVHVTDNIEDQFYYDRQGELVERLTEHLAPASGEIKIQLEVLPEANLLDSIEGYAKKNHAHLVAFAMSKKNFFERMIDPSVSENALFHLHVPMLFLRAQDSSR
ncbi:MAG: universal stress protein [Bacteroidia bacterium]|nr:universal stress protein [Bacteroidia bacterium]